MSPCQNCTPGDSHALEQEKNSLIDQKQRKDNEKTASVWKTQVLVLLLSRVPKSQFVICSKMAAVGNRKHLFVVVWFSSPCSNMFTARGSADRRNIWLLCIAERAHIYYTWSSVHLPESQPVCSSISANTRTHDNNPLFLWCLQAAQTPNHI